MSSKEKAIIVDIDGTLANIKHRREKLIKDNNWNEFNSKMDLDTVNNWCLEIINQFRQDYRIILVTGRKKQFEEITLRWLATNRVYFDHIFFRDDDDYKADDIVKDEIFKTKIDIQFDILFVVDDRSKVVRKWRELGLVCLQCGEGDF